MTELLEHTRSYGTACTRRNRKIIVVSGVLLFLAFLSIPISPKLFIIPVAGLAGLAIYVIVTCRRWHRLHGVFCPHCRRPLTEINDQLEEIILGAPVPDSLECPNCREIVARYDALKPR